MPEGFDPSNESVLQAIEHGNPADQIITAKNLDDWLSKLDFDDITEATDFAMTVNKCFELKTSLDEPVGQIKTKGELMAQEVLRIAKSRCSIQAKRTNKYADIVSGIMAMALRRKQDRDFDSRNAR